MNKINKIDSTDSKYVDAIKNCFSRDTYQQIIDIQNEYEKKLRELNNKVNSKKLEELFIGKYIKINNDNNFPNSSYNTYAYVKDVCVYDNEMWGLAISLKCSAFDTALGNDNKEVNKIGNFDKNRYIDFDLDKFLDFSIGWKYKKPVVYDKDDDSGYDSVKTVVDNNSNEYKVRNGILTFITEEEFKSVYDEYTQKLYNDLMKDENLGY